MFVRNPDVVAEALHRAAGVCEVCVQPAPFTRKSNGTPYLEVHHKIRLADGGLDTLENAVALCPNCHRASHYG
ncbi:HNH endonuclease [Pseudomonas sp. TNT2022 ID357]|uniref:HNH endonuclease n=3 Tax=Pseudomonas TaxID=286 RepID=A0ABT5Q738_9PSED|nr:HNH endonuclease signature motif containing protein [Pseudomonas idahonensis]MDD1149814.1 HNH endonuclease [Pseudomonas idahonensis]